MPDRRIEFALLGLLALFWGSSYVVAKAALAEIPPLTLVAARVSVAAIFLLLVLALRGERLPRGRRTWAALLVQAVCNSIGAWTILAWGQQHIDSGLAAVLNSTSPIFAYFIALVWAQDEGVHPRRLAGALIGSAGVAAIVGVEALDGIGTEVAGELAALAGACLYAIAAIYGRRFASLPPAATAAGTMLWATAWLLPASLIFDRPWTLAPSADAVMAALTLGVVCTGAALLLYFRLIRTLGSLGVASNSYLRAGVGVLLGWLIFGETISLSVGLGLAAAVVGVALINARPRRLRA